MNPPLPKQDMAPFVEALASPFIEPTPSTPGLFEPKRLAAPRLNPSQAPTRRRAPRGHWCREADVAMSLQYQPVIGGVMRGY